MIDLQPASVDIYNSKYRLRSKSGEPVESGVMDTFSRVAHALADVEETGEKRALWYNYFFWAMKSGAIPAGRILSNAGAGEHKPNTSLINCCVSSTIHDSMYSILDVLKDAGMLLKAGCVAPGTMVYTEQGVVKAEEAVSGLHSRILCYDRSSKRFEMRDIQRHLVTHVPKSENIEIVSGGVSLRTSIHHPVLVYRDGSLKYVRAGDIVLDDAIVRHRFDWVADEDAALTAWFVGAHLGDGSAYERKPISYSPARKAYAERARLFGRRLVFKIRKSEQAVVEKYAQFFENFCGANARIVATETINGTPVWDYTVSSYGATKASRLIDEQTGKKCRTLKVPAWIASRPDLYFLPFLAGLIDTDGTVTQHNGSASISMTSDSFCDELKSTLGLFGVSCGITKVKPSSHIYRDREIKCAGGCSLKISDSDFLVSVARYMVDGKKKKRIIEHATTSGQFERYVVPNDLRDSIDRASVGLDASEKQCLGFYNGTNKKHFVSRIVLDKFERRFPEMREQIEFARTLRKVDEINRDLDISETFYDFTVEGNNNYLAGNSGMMVIHNCGVGYCFSTLRPKGSHVAGAGAKTSGPLSFMDVYDALCKTISSAGGRRGAQMATFDIGHPDVQEFVKAKREDGRLRQFNLSLLVSDEFMATLERDGDWPLSFGGTVHRTVKARHLWDMVMASTYDYAEPGVLFVDRINEMNNLWFCEDIRATNPSMAAGTLVHTKQGIVPIESLQDKEFQVRAMDGTWGRARCWLSSEAAETMTVTFSDGSTKIATPEHKWPVLNASTGKIIRTTTDHLRECDFVPKTSVSHLEIEGDLSLTEEDGFFVGTWLADGTLTKRSDNGAFQIGFTINAEDSEILERVLSYVNSKKSRVSNPDIVRNGAVEFSFQGDAAKEIADRFRLSCGDKTFPSIVYRSNDRFVRGFVDGFVSGDGYVSDAGSCARIIVCQSKKEVLSGFSDLLSFMGLTGRFQFTRRGSKFPNGKDYKKLYDRWDFILSKSSVIKFSSLFSLTCKRKQERLNDIVNSGITRSTDQSNYVKVVSVVKNDGKIPVWDVSVDHEQHLFPVSGYYTGNCGEQALPPNGSCLLGSVDLTKFVKNPFENSAHFDFDRYRKVVAIFARMLDNVVEIANLPVKAYSDELIRKRRHGMGYFGLGSAMAMLGMRYGDERSLKFTNEVTRMMAHENWKQALELSLEKGPAPIMEETFADHCGARGKHLHANSRYMKKIHEIDPGLVDNLNRHGARFSHATSIAPTGCVDKDTLVVSENGLSRISEIGVATGDQWQQIRLSVATDRGFRQASHYFVNGSKPTIKITTSEGRQFIATPNHRIRAFCEGKLYDWIRMDEVMVGCVIPTVIDNYPECSFDDLIACSPSPSCGTFVSPSILTGEIAFVIGFLHSNGNVKTNRHIRFFHHSSYADDVFNFIERVLGECFSLRGKVFRSKCDSMKELHVYSKPLVDWLNLNGMGKNKSHDISVPKAIMMGGREVVYGYMRGLFEGDGTMGNAIALTSTSEMFLRDIQVLLQSVGIVSKFGISGNPENEGHIGNRVVYRVSINHAIDKIRFMDRIGFISIKGDKRISVSRNMNRRMMTSSIRNTISDAFGVKPSKEMRYLVDFEKTSDCEFHYERIEKIESCESETFDLSVPSNTTYIANNIVSHNTISLSVGNNASNGIEPSFAHEYSRNVIVEGKKSKESVKVYSLEALAWRELHGDEPLPEHCVTTDQIAPEDHIAVQAAAQKWIDSSISKSVNVPSDISFERFRDIYMLAYKSGLKGCTTFRFNPERFQGVLVKEDDLKNTVYRFDLENGDSVEFRGDDVVEYEGEKHTAANLFDAIKEGYYGKL